MTASEELANLRAYVAELRSLADQVAAISPELPAATWPRTIAAEIDARFLAPSTIAPPPNYTPEQLEAFEKGWNEMLQNIDRTAGFRVVAPEPVFAYGERASSNDSLETIIREG